MSVKTGWALMAALVAAAVIAVVINAQVSSSSSATPAWCRPASRVINSWIGDYNGYIDASNLAGHPIPVRQLDVDVVSRDAARMRVLAHRYGSEQLATMSHDIARWINVPSGSLPAGSADDVLIDRKAIVATCHYTKNHSPTSTDVQ